MVMDVDAYFKNYNFWMEPIVETKVDIRSDIDSLIDRLETVSFTEKTSARVMSIADQLLRHVFVAVSDTTGCFTLTYNIGENFVRFEDVRNKHHARYFLGDAYIIDRETYKPLVIGHIHADESLDSLEDVKHAEDFMKLSLEEWVDCAPTEFLYGVIIIGGSIAFYQMDKTNQIFSRLVDGEFKEIESTPSLVKWMSLTRHKGLGELLGIVMKNWFELYPDFAKKAFEFRRKKLEEMGYKDNEVKNEVVEKADVNTAVVEAVEGRAVSGESSSSESSPEKGEALETGFGERTLVEAF